MDQEGSEGQPHRKKGFVTREAMPATILLIFGIVFLVEARDLHLGTASRMGPGYFPLVLSIILIATSGLLVLRGWRQNLAGIKPEYRSMLLVSVSILAFAGIYLLAGLLPAIAICIGLTMVMDGRNSWKETLLATVFAVALLWVIFIYLLELPMPSIRGLF